MEMDDKNVVSIEDRIPKLKQVRKKKANRRLIFYLSIFFFLIAIIVYLQSPLSHVKHIEVSGHSLLTTEDIIEKSHLTSSTNIWTINREEVIESIQKHPVVKSVDVVRKLPRTIEINITEHQHIGYIKENGDFFPLLGNGSLLLDTPFPMKGDAPLLMAFNEETYLLDLTKELQQLPESILNLISEIHWRPTDENKSKILLYMNDGFTVDASIRNFANKMKAYPSIVSQLDEGSEGIIHLGVGAYFESYDNN